MEWIWIFNHIKHQSWMYSMYFDVLYCTCAANCKVWQFLNVMIWCDKKTFNIPLPQKSNSRLQTFSEAGARSPQSRCQCQHWEWAKRCGKKHRNSDMAMGQTLLYHILGWTSIYHLFCSPDTRVFTHSPIAIFDKWVTLFWEGRPSTFEHLQWHLLKWCCCFAKLAMPLNSVW